jgi:transcriptional regulator with XRE-family HTH domain
VDDDGSNPIEKWLAGESDEVQMTFNSALKEARKQKNYLDWPCFRHKMKGKPGAEAWKPASSAPRRLHKEGQIDMNERSKMISKLIKRRDSRESYIRSKLSVLLPAQIRSLRLRREMKQAELGAEAEMKQGRISVLERIGEVSFSIETLIKLASAFRVGLIVKFVPMSEMLNWENAFAPDEFDVVPLERDEIFLHPEQSESQNKMSPGLCEAMLRGQDNFMDFVPAHSVQSVSESSLWQSSIVVSSSQDNDASSLSNLKFYAGSASMSATQSQHNQEQGCAA